ncbi:low affinity iron permease family protein [Chryseobacterium sp.]|uniref:low affinity iron permease family protein n=1 Tax=Chryseobacterium sp. TaxID=1871047 RepID=UPI0035ADE0F4
MIKDILDRWPDWREYFKGSAFLGIAGLAVLFIRNTQNKEIKTLQHKLDELMAARKENKDREAGNLTEDEMSQLHTFYEDLERQRREKNIPDNNRPENLQVNCPRYK